MADNYRTSLYVIIREQTSLVGEHFDFTQRKFVVPEALKPAPPTKGG